VSGSPAGGSLNPGGTAAVPVTLRPAVPRLSGVATVTISGAGRTETVRITWEGEASVSPSSG